MIIHDPRNNSARTNPGDLESGWYRNRVDRNADRNGFSSDRQKKERQRVFFAKLVRFSIPNHLLARVASLTNLFREGFDLRDRNRNDLGTSSTPET